ncbi:hypothetical protein [Aestuariicoccus sp. MJ-SS9]|uniref:hypothetical protein n=1 Tax=Aestuariicoccus sp. MJ-SS9 TaxID=3079855 RepID=UPI00290FFF85|nr:hypothetical protein [Aestuariicoccus sp. MJ-SS9]MDU8910912.1 hypothetical protein [Aestuariicoccus sp. MJ-SS9]
MEVIARTGTMEVSCTALRVNRDRYKAFLKRNKERKDDDVLGKPISWDNLFARRLFNRVIFVRLTFPKSVENPIHGLEIRFSTNDYPTFGFQPQLGQMQ